MATSNIQIVDGFFNINGSEQVAFGSIIHQFIRNCSPQFVLSSLIRLLNLEASNWDYPFILDLFNKLERTGEFTSIDIVKMTINYERKRTFIDGVIGRIPQGRSQNREPGDPSYYVGDEYIHENRPQLQFHYFKPTSESTGISSDVRTIAFALYIPPYLADATGRLVRSSV